ncbi:hypothetical protein AAC03nite_22710 [Alicyclobacillus acidoterrestris]|nr:hypothetical protein AAC03nite_22710 [Alicyclobacillus acidoterrestris]
MTRVNRKVNFMQQRRDMQQAGLAWHTAYMTGHHEEWLNVRSPNAEYERTVEPMSPDCAAHDATDATI